MAHGEAARGANRARALTLAGTVALSVYVFVAEPTYVTRVIDGDTLVTNDGTVRLLGVDAPERGECYGKQASQYVEKWLTEQKVRLTKAPTTSSTDGRGRLLRFVAIRGVDVGRRLVRYGFALVEHRDPVSRTPTYLVAERRARRERAGLWGACGARVGGEARAA